MNYKKNARYFKKNRALSVVLIYLATVVVAVLGVLLWFVFGPNAQKHSGVLILIGIILASVGGFGVLLHSVICLVRVIARPSDQEIDAVYQMLADEATATALEKAGFSADTEVQAKPVVLSSCFYENIFTDFKIKVGRDKAMRSSNFANFVLLFDSDQILIYRNSRSIIREEWKYSISEYYYSDIVSLTTTVSAETVTDKSGEHVVKKETLNLITSSGAEIELPFQNNDEAKDAIIQLRQILRSKKRVPTA